MHVCVDGGAYVSEAVSDFWTELVERVFTLLNPHYHFSVDYLECVSKHTQHLQPLGELQRKLSTQVTCMTHDKCVGCVCVKIISMCLITVMHRSYI